MNKLEQLKTMTEVVADTGDIEAIGRFKPIDATTNPSLLLKAATYPAYQPLVARAVRDAQLGSGSSREQLATCVQSLSVAIGAEILDIIPGRVSVEVDAHQSFDMHTTITLARQIITRFGARGIGPERVLIKIAATWEGIAAARELEKEGIHCNLTLLFGFSQAAACADAGVFLISPFVGRILDWYKAKTGKNDYPADEDPGVVSVTQIYRYYKQHGYATVVMGASFRNAGEIEALAGCDKLTISPDLLQELAADLGDLPRRLDPASPGAPIARLIQSEPAFRFALNDDAMATEKLAEGIRRFASDQRKLESLLVDRAGRAA